VLPVEFSRLFSAKNLYNNRLQSARDEFIILKGITTFISFAQVHPGNLGLWDFTGEMQAQNSFFTGITVFSGLSSVFLKKLLQWGWGRVNYRFEIALSQGVADYL